MCEMAEDMINMQKQMDMMSMKINALLRHLKLAVQYEPESYEVIKESEMKTESQAIPMRG